MSGTDYLCQTIGVPQAWAVPYFLPDGGKKILSIHGVGGELPLHATDSIVWLCKTVKTLDAYDTQAGVLQSSQGNEVLLDDSKPWLIKPKYKVQLKAIGKRFKVDVGLVEKVDQTVRMRRLRRKCHYEDKVLLYAMCTTENEGASIWMDASYSSIVPCQHFTETKFGGTLYGSRQEQANSVTQGLSQDKPRIGNRCGNCGKVDSKEKRHKLCSRCKKMYYCNAACQKSHWEFHKDRC